MWLVVVLLVVLGGCGSQEEPREETRPPEATSADHPAPMTDGRTVAQRLEDATLATEVRKALLDTMRLRLFDFEVEAERGRVALRGSVDTDAQRTLAATIAREVEGVRDLDNQIALFPPDSVNVKEDSTKQK